MSATRRGVLYVDHAEALIFALLGERFTRSRIAAKGIIGNLHHKAGPRGPGHPRDQRSFHSAVAAALNSFDEILIMGHGTARSEFAHYLQQHEPQLSSHVVESLSVDHPTEREIVAMARDFFDRRKLFRLGK